MPTDELALLVANQMRRQTADLARTISQALDDGTVSPLEWLTIGARGSTLALTLLATLQGTSAAERQRILHVYTQGQLVLPPAPPVSPPGPGS